MRAVAADDKAGIDRFRLALVLGIETFETNGDRCLGGVRRDGEVDQAVGVIGRQAGRGVAHGVEEEIVHARLVEDHVREFGESVLDVLDAVAANQSPVGLVGFPEGNSLTQ